MSHKKSNPPGLAIWILQHACPGDNDALTGDLIERFHAGQTVGWFWKQVLIAFAVSVRREIRRRWPHFCYAIAGTAMPVFLWKTVEGAPDFLHWWALPWPWSQMVLELSRPALLALAALPVLGFGLVINRTFQWISLFRTAWINLSLITLGKYLLDFLLDAFPSLLRPTADPHVWRILILPPAFAILLAFSRFLVAAWLGCLSPPEAAPHDMPAENPFA